MKEEVKQYLESETKLNKQEFHIREIMFKISISLIIIGLGVFVFAMYKALS